MDDAHDLLAYRSPLTAAKTAAVPFDDLSLTSQNGVVRRWMLLAIGLSALLWTASARTGSAPSVVTMLDAGSCQLTGDSRGPSDSDRQWRAQQYTIAAVTESVWKSALVHAAFAATPSPLVFESSRSTSSPDPPAGSAPHYLRHTPLLI